VARATIYGVAVPGHEGRCGMAALEVAPGFDLASFHAHCAQAMPAYARPVFVRLVENLAVTETFKPKKQALALEGFDPARVQGPLYADLGNGYAVLDQELYARINSGLIRL
jgi:fatty-acyl-CoA synthase